LTEQESWVAPMTGAKRHRMKRADKLVNLAMGATSGKRKGIIKRLTKRPYHSFQEAGMKLSRQEVESIAHLARLEISADEIPVYVDNLSRIIDFVRQLDRAQTEGVEPMAHPLNMTQPLREDAVTESDRRELYQQNSQAVKAGLYLVPRVIE
jgi:aspartyl-tRNA(Asn)/glutamyl-tRNA(Gln) amidotransferase subunit C